MIRRFWGSLRLAGTRGLVFSRAAWATLLLGL